jgi:hypothetical protein
VAGNGSTASDICQKSEGVRMKITITPKSEIAKQDPAVMEWCLMAEAIIESKAEEIEAETSRRVIDMMIYGSFSPRELA